MNIKDMDITARTLYGEARGEYPKVDGGLSALIAVANVIHNRFLQGGFGKTHSEVCRKPFQFSCWNERDPNRDLIETVSDTDPIFKLCQRVTKHVLLEDWPDLTKGSNHYHTRDIYPYWSAKKHPQITIGRHHFYKLGG
jgi:spore germination cell wall hydrolase CwlJ-like protein